MPWYHTDASQRLATFDLGPYGTNVHQEVMELLERLLKSRHRGAGGELVDALHGRAGAQPERLGRAVWAAMRAGPGVERTGNGEEVFMSPFAEACCLVKRLDILQAVLDAGPPAWMDEPLSREEWLRELLTLENNGSKAYSLYEVAHRCMAKKGYPVELTEEIVRLAIRHDTNDRTRDSLSSRWPEFGAFIRRERMRLQIEGAAETSAASPAPVRRRLAV